jgi:uncharacterized protein
MLFGGLGIWLNQSFSSNSAATVETVQPTQTTIVAISNSPQPSPSSPENPVSLQSLVHKQFDGRDFNVGQVLERNSAYTRYFITYKSGDLTISGIMNVPTGQGPFPLLILNHGYIDPAVYTNGRGLKREQDYLARQGYVVIHPDYRNHAQSSKDSQVELNLRLGYVEDVINVIKAVQIADLPYINTDEIGMLGHSMGGGVAQAVIVTQPTLVKAVVLFAPVSSDMRDNFNRWTITRPQVAQTITILHGAPNTNSDFWNTISPNHFFSNVAVPVAIHHGTADDSVPVAWSQQTETVLKQAGKDVTLYTYPGEPHEFMQAWPTVMQRTTSFFDTYLK